MPVRHTGLMDASRSAERETTEALAGVGPHLRLLRHERTLTLAEVAAATGVSVSTLSRLESGERRPALELLLPLARLYGVTLDRLVDAPATGDPRVDLRPVTVGAMTMVPLSERAVGIQAYKIVMTAAHPSGEQKSHAGYEWVYVLRGTLRLMLGEHDIVMAAGEAAEFDTRVPHSFGSAGADPVEFLSLFGEQGQRAHLVAGPRPAQRGASGADTASTRKP